MLKGLLIGALFFFALGGCATLLSFIAFDRLLKAIKAASEEEWTALGKPLGFFWVPAKGLSMMHSSSSRSDLYLRWTRCTAKNDVVPEGFDAKDLRRYHRAGQACFLLGGCLLIAFVTVIFVR